jgi:hypothetical protein
LCLYFFLSANSPNREQGSAHCRRRAKSGDASVHPISARESRALRKLLREAATSPIDHVHGPLHGLDAE